MNASERMSENEYDNRVDPCYRASEFTTDLNNIDIPLEVARSDSKYYLNSHKDTPLPTLTNSQQKDFIPERERIKLNNILHTGKLTNCNISTFSDYEFADSSFVEDVLDDSPEITKCLNASEIEKGCCYLI